jgi:hypothetical protein
MTHWNIVTLVEKRERCKPKNKRKKKRGKFVFIKEIPQIGWFITLIG